MIEGIDKEVFYNTYQNPQDGLPKCLQLMVDKINELVDEQNKIRLGNR